MTHKPLPKTREHDEARLKRLVARVCATPEGQYLYDFCVREDVDIELRAEVGGSASKVGQYDHDDKIVEIRRNLSDDTLVWVLFHEMAHVWQHSKRGGRIGGAHLCPLDEHKQTLFMEAHACTMEFFLCVNHAAVTGDIAPLKSCIRNFGTNRQTLELEVKWALRVLGGPLQDTEKNQLCTQYFRALLNDRGHYPWLSHDWAFGDVEKKVVTGLKEDIQTLKKEGPVAAIRSIFRHHASAGRLTAGDVMRLGRVLPQTGDFAAPNKDAIKETLSMKSLHHKQIRHASKYLRLKQEFMREFRKAARKQNRYKQNGRRFGRSDRRPR